MRTLLLLLLLIPCYASAAPCADAIVDDTVTAQEVRPDVGDVVLVEGDLAVCPDCRAADVAPASDVTVEPIMARVLAIDTMRGHLERRGQLLSAIHDEPAEPHPMEREALTAWRPIVGNRGGAPPSAPPL